MRSNNPESVKLYNLKVKSTTLSKQLKYEKNEQKRAELESELWEVESEIDMIYTAREGEAHIKWLLSEFGEDVFPDRD
ncbi:hypothetical protein MICAE_440004 [Microcystis aeruginosa PCC 9806]|jgi:hypothetical protein|uniref:Uncharacterized protein n=3 Tax=Microcystis TaxID=1125 RepID=A0A2Z6US34_MICAE|nr:hypothetical protein [Microcystis aeruginosa]TRV20750.1 MAG: hypothetical protein EWV40_12930 [Microcystis flos-aquae Mf_WU_F_19750830_S460]MBE9089017.1 hypothetical protein [Microcystis aeruginosa LEGE 11464]MDB9427812.1 hypothetical protein [Microcystis aeruginosa CS-555/01A07]CCI14915.1 hypothetical protein MICAE_440004 [Microcystis aeruginosa PCC 9806]GBL10876.1 hypothetical protein MSj_02371 [Microcystis aeruginosa Sj]